MMWLAVSVCGQRVLMCALSVIWLRCACVLLCPKRQMHVCLIIPYKIGLNRAVFCFVPPNNGDYENVAITNHMSNYKNIFTAYAILHFQIINYLIYLICKISQTATFCRPSVIQQFSSHNFRTKMSFYLAPSSVRIEWRCGFHKQIAHASVTRARQQQLRILKW